MAVNLHPPYAVTPASAASAFSSLALDSYSQRLTAASGSAFAEEFEECASSQEQRAPHSPSVQDRGPARHAPTSAKQQKDNNVDRTAAVATPATAVTPQALPLDLHSGSQETPDDAAAQADEAGASLQPVAGGGPQPAATTQGPELAAGDPQNTAFMMRMQVAGADDGSTLQQGLMDAGKKLGDTPDSAPLPDTLVQTQSALAALGESRQLEPGAEIKQVAAVSQAPEPQALRTDEQPPQPLNSILLQVNQSANEKVLVSLVQQSGELRLSVRTDDSELAQGLQQGLPDLVGKLQGNGYRADAWHPVQSSVAAAPAPESQNASNQSRQGDSQSPSGQSQQDGGQQRQNQSNRPRWVEELESTLTSKPQTQGESYGFTS
ncbi:MAG: hypothetical protein ABSF64_25690 [Bryobacteraceae bacterium]